MSELKVWVNIDEFLRSRSEPYTALMWCLRCRRTHLHRLDPAWMDNRQDSWQCLTCYARRATGLTLTSNGQEAGNAVE